MSVGNINFNGEIVQGVYLVDPTTGAPYSATSGGGAGSGVSVDELCFFDAATSSLVVRRLTLDGATSTYSLVWTDIDGNAISTPTGPLSLALPAGAATAAKQDTGNTSIASIDTKTPALGQALAASSSPVVLPQSQIDAIAPLATQPISASSLPLPTGAATSSKQDSALTALNSLLVALKDSWLAVTVTGRTRDPSKDLAQTFGDGTAQTIYFDSSSEYAGQSVRA